MAGGIFVEGIYKGIKTEKVVSKKDGKEYAFNYIGVEVDDFETIPVQYNRYDVTKYKKGDSLKLQVSLSNYRNVIRYKLIENLF